MTDKQGPPSNRTEEFVRLLRENDRRLTAYVHALVPGWADAEDVLQETSVRLWEQFDKFEQGTNFGAWSCTIARYMVLALRERKGRDRLWFSDSLLEKIGAEVESLYAEEGDSRRRLLAGCIDQLSPSNRELLRSCYSEGMKVKEAASQMGRTVNAVYLALSRLRKWLHKCVEDRIRVEEIS